MAIPTQRIDITAKPQAESSLSLSPPHHSPSYQQAKSRWQHSWQTVIEQCSDYFIRY